MRTLMMMLLLLALPALAGEAADAKKAKDAFAAGQKLYKADRYAEAILKFEEAFAAKPHPVIYFNIARCYEQLQEPAKAAQAYRDYLRLSPEAKDRAAVTETIASLDRKAKEQTAPRLTVTTDPAHARVEVDGKALSGVPALAELSTGPHRVVVSLDGYERAERTVTLSGGQALELTVALRKASPPRVSDAPRKEPAPVALTPPPMPPSAQVTRSDAEVEAPRKRVFAWVASGVAVAGLGSGIALGLVSSSANSTLHATPAATQAEADARVAAVKGPALGANISYGVAAVAAITAVVLFIVEK
jgi:hypothetical protein